MVNKKIKDFEKEEHKQKGLQPITVVFSVVLISLLLLGFFLIKDFFNYDIEIENFYKDYCSKNISDCYQLNIYPIEEKIGLYDPDINITGEWTYLLEARNGSIKDILAKGKAVGEKTLLIKKGVVPFIWGWSEGYYSTSTLDIRSLSTDNLTSSIELVKAGELIYMITPNKLEENKTTKIHLFAKGNVNYLGMCLKSLNIEDLKINTKNAWSLETPKQYKDYDSCKDLGVSLNNNKEPYIIELTPTILNENPELKIVIFDTQRGFQYSKKYHWIKVQKVFDGEQDIGIKNIEIRLQV